VRRSRRCSLTTSRAPARAHALGRLREFTFHRHDCNHLHVDREGSPYFACQGPALAPADAATTTSTVAAAGVLVASAMQMSVGEATYPVMGAIKWQRNYYAMLASPLGIADLVLGHLGYLLVRVVTATAAFLLVGALLGAFTSWWALLAGLVAVLCGIAHMQTNDGVWYPMGGTGAVPAALAEIGEARRARAFFLRMEELAADAAEKAWVVRLASRAGPADHAVWVSRRAGAAGVAMPVEGWPAPYGLYPLGAGAEPEPGLVNAVTRQESNFDPEAISSANARGLMQLLPATAQAVAKRLGLRHHTGMLLNDPLHNMRLGAGYLDQMMARFGGALPLAVAAYNAGPARVDEWLGTLGDPRGVDVPMLDWMEMIPFTETRNYVQRVIENMPVYRARDPATASLEHPMARWLRGNG